MSSLFDVETYEKKDAILYNPLSELSLEDIENSYDISREIVFQRAQESVDSLSPKEQKILFMRYGFYDGEPWTLEEVAYEFGCTRENIRQIEKKALGKLHSSATEYSFFAAVNDYSGLHGRNLQRFRKAVRCLKCGTWNMPTDELSYNCPKCMMIENYIKKFDLTDFSMEKEENGVFFSNTSVALLLSMGFIQKNLPYVLYVPGRSKDRI